ncbi:MAG: hypothetical protein KKE73_03835 [Proteobacteria bacterium]|nr:hypothetical protein [Pseudomonadota bacterium]
MLSATDYTDLELRTLADTEGQRQAVWACELTPCTSAEDMLAEAVWVILGSGISYNAARSMERELNDTGRCAHPGKAKAIAYWQKNYKGIWAEYSAKATDAERLAYLRRQPYFRGDALPFLLAKNLGMTSYCKPDVHLVRLAARHGYESAQAMCEDLARQSGHTVAYVDTIIWFAAMKGWAYEIEALTAVL